MASRKDRFKRLYDEFGAPIVNKILQALGDGADEATVRKALRQQGYKPISQNEAAQALKQAASRPRTTTQSVRTPPPATELAVKPGRKGFATRFQPASKEPIVTQAGRAGLPVAGAEQMAVAHPSPFGAFATIKPSKPASEMSSGYLPAEEIGPLPPGRNAPLAVFDPDAPRKTFSVEDLENSMVVSLLGDRTSAGRRVVDIDGTPVNVMTYGGPRYGEFNEAMGSPAVWASERSPISSLRNQIRGGLEQGLDVYGVYTAMGPRSLDQTTMMTDALLQQARARGIGGRDAAAFDSAMREVVPDFVGIGDPGAYQQLASLPQGQRLQFTQRMDNAKLLEAGFPDVSATRIALTEPELLDAPAGSSGFSVVKLGPESLKDFDISLPHPTYPVQMAGETVGRFPEMVPFDMVFSDLVSERRGAGAAAGKDLRALELRRPAQVVTPEQLERLLRYLEAVER